MVNRAPGTGLRASGTGHRAGVPNSRAMSHWVILLEDPYSVPLIGECGLQGPLAVLFKMIQIFQLGFKVSRRPLPSPLERTLFMDSPLARRFILSRFRRDEEDRKYSSSFVKEDPDDAERWPSTTGSKSF